MAVIHRTTYRTAQGEEAPLGWSFFCPGCDMDHSIQVDNSATPGGPQWSFDGNEEAPTFSPSIRVQYTWGESNERRVCHSFVQGGNLVYLSDCTHALAGQTIPLPCLSGRIYL